MITKEIASFIKSTTYPKLSESVVKQAKLCFLDFLAVSLRGSKTTSANIIRNIIPNLAVTELNESPWKWGISTVFGGEVATPSDAALINGVAAHSLDLDDGHRLAHLHPGACVIPASLALSEAFGKSGKDFITSLVVGYQVTIILGMLMNPEHRENGFHSTGTCGTLGAAAASCSLMDLDVEQTLDALGLAGTQAAGLLISDHSGSMAKHLHTGRAAQSGVLSTLLAIEGFTGARDIIEGQEGIIDAMVRPLHSPPFHAGKKNIDLQYRKLEKDKYKPINSGDFEIMKVYFKKYPVCRHLHSSLDATIDIMQNNATKRADIQEITVETYQISALHNKCQPTTTEGIRQSLPVTIAIAIKEGNITVENISKIPLDNEIMEIANKVKIKLDKDLDNLYPQKRPSRVTIKTRDHIYSKRIDLAKGEPENPFDKKEITNKFNNLNPQLKVNFLKILDDLESLQINEMMNELNQEFNNRK